MRRLAQLLATLAGRASRLAGRGGGTSLPGNLLLRLRPEAARELASEFDLRSIAVSATNGKTTTARLIVAGATAAGHDIIANTAGANLLSGITTTLLDARSRSAHPHLGVFEVDEAALGAVAKQVAPNTIVLMNLFRDQLDRYGELETLLDKWRDLVGDLDPSVCLVLNADDPGIASLAEHHDNVIWFGLDDPASMRDHLSHAADSTRCRRCSSELAYSGVTIGHFGHWSCTNCDNARPVPDIQIDRVTSAGMDTQLVLLTTPSGPVTLELGLPGLHNAYNAAAAAAALGSIDVAPTDIAAGLKSADAAFGRAEKLTIDGHAVWLLLAKNPTGANENLRTVLSADQPVHVLALLNDRTADGRDVSWIWDVDYEHLLPHLAQLTVAGDRANDLALRFRYAGIEPDLLNITSDPAAALDSALAALPAGAPLFVLPTYTAMLDLRSVLTDRGVTAAFWEDN